mgnify:CR=1 FL=1
MTNPQMARQIADKNGFIAALDQSGGSTPKALRLYGVNEDAYSNDEEMFGLIHEMRARIIKAPAFNGEKVIGAILFERTMDGEVDGTPTAEYLWNAHQVVPFLKVDKGLADEANGVQMMKPMPDLDHLLERAVGKGIFGTKMRSVINAANQEGIAAIVAQQFDVGRQILGHGLMPIIEPEVTITIADKAEAEDILLAEITKQLDALGEVLIEKLRTFNVECTLGGRTAGPVVTQYEVIPAPGVKVNKIASLDADLALAMKAKSIRIVAPVPGRGAVGVEIPNPEPEVVRVVQEGLGENEAEHGYRYCP